MLNILNKKIATFIYLSANIDGDISSMLGGRGGVSKSLRGGDHYIHSMGRVDNIER